MKKFKQLRSEKHLISTDWENFVRKSEDVSTSAVYRKDSLLLGARGQFSLSKLTLCSQFQDFCC